MDAIGVAQATLLGNSLGCQVIGHLVIGHPGRVSRAVLVGPTRDRRVRQSSGIGPGSAQESQLAEHLADHVALAPGRYRRFRREAQR